MFDDLIEKIVAMLPEQIREKLPERFQGEKLGDDDKTGDVKIDVGDVTQVDEVDEDVSDEDAEEDDEDDEDDEDEEDEDDEKTKKRSRLIKIIVIGAIIWFGLDMMTEQPETVKKVTKISKKKAKKKEVVEKAIKTPVAQKEDPPVTTEPIKEVVDPIEEELPVAISEPIEEEAPEVVTQPIVEPTADSEVPDVELPDSTLVLPNEFKSEKLGESSDAKVTDDQLDKLFADDQGPEEKDQVERPDFERVGAGLVYNCKGKHWACLDRKNYFLCRDLELAVGDGKPECVIVETYASVEDCQVMQVYKVNRANPPLSCKFED